MSISTLTDIVHSSTHESWSKTNNQAFESLFGSPGGRYPKQALKKDVTIRAPEMSGDAGVPFAAYIHPQNPTSGPYSGLSFALFPAADEPCLIGLVVGTQGLSPDEAILGRPGHARKAQAICSWLNKEFGKGRPVAWAKQDPTRTDISVPDGVTRAWSAYKSVFDRYGKELYALYCPTDERAGTEAALTAFLDILFEERGYQPIASALNSYQAIRSNWFRHLMPAVEASEIADLLSTRRYVILQGPPGTGKTRMATELLKNVYQGRGHSVQFHPNTTYENFVAVWPRQAQAAN